MAGGFLKGLLTGVVVAGAGLVVASQIAPPPVSPDVSDTAPETVPMARAGAEPAVTVAAPAPSAPPVVADAAEAAPEPDSLSPIPEDVRQSAAVPEVGIVADSALALPSVAPQGGAMRAGPEDRTPSGPVGAAPAAPLAQDELSITTNPAQPSAPAGVEGSGFGAIDTAPAAAPVVPEDAPSKQVTAVAPAAPVGDDLGADAPNASDLVTGPDGVGTASSARETPAPAGTAVAPDAPAEPAAETDSPEIASGDGDIGASEDPAPQVIAAAPRIATPVVPLTERDDPAPVLRRLPTITADPEPAEPNSTAEGEADPATPDGPPVVAFAQEFDRTPGKPVMSIVLIDDGDAVGVEALQAFPYPLSFAVDPMLPDATERMARHRAAGFEVLALVDLPRGGSAQDAETGMEVILADMTEVVGIMEGTRTGIQTSREMADQVAAILVQSGHGLVALPSGLNTFQKLAARDGVPSAVVFRDFDGNGQSPVVMRRFLDQAAFRAGQEGGVVMMGRVRPDTISALLLWGLQDRASRVSLAPVSAVLATTPVSQ